MKQISIIISVLLISSSLVKCESQNQYDYYGGDIEQPGDGFNLGASGSIIQKPNAERLQAGEVRYSTAVGSTAFKAKAGVDYSKNQYGNVNIDYKAQINENTGSLEVIGDGNYFNGKKNGTVNASLNSANYYSSSTIGANLAIDDEGNKDYSGFLNAREQFNPETEGQLTANAHGNDVNGNAKIQMNSGALVLSGLAFGDYGIQEQSLKDYGYGGEVSTNFDGNHGSIGVGAIEYKNTSKNGYGYAKYEDSFLSGNVQADAFGKYDLNTNQVTEKQADITVTQILNDDLSVSGESHYLNGQTDLVGNVNLDTNIASVQVKAQGSESYDYNHQTVTDKSLSLDLSKKFSNGNLDGLYKWENRKSNSQASGSFVNYINNAKLTTSGTVDNDYDKKNITGAFKALLDHIKFGDIQTGVFTDFTTKFQNDYTGVVGAFLHNSFNTTSASIAFNGNLRGGQKEIQSTVISFDHQVDWNTFVHLDITKYPNGTYELNGNLKTKVGSASLVLYIKMDRDGNFSFSM